jgi:carbon-monoxide dehydrogenase medium subunit
MSGVEYFEPRTLEEACELTHRYAEDGKVLAGGTALVLLMRQRLLAPAQLVNVQHVAELAGIHANGADGRAASRSELVIGALVTHAEAARSTLVREQYLALAETFRHVATPRIRNAGTVGGNLAHGDPHLDPPVTLLALDAHVTARSVRGEREIPLGDFFRDYYETALEPDEILKQVSVPAPPARSGLSFIKYLPRSQDDYATVDVAVWLRLADGSDVVEESRIALGSVGPTPIRAHDAERQLVGQTLSDELLAQAGELAAQACDPEDDVRGSAAYKRELVKVVVRRAAYQAQDDARRRAAHP